VTGQLAFELPLRPALGRDAFFAAPSNAAALAAVDGWRGWPGGRLVLAGPTGSGKTHLAMVFAQATGAAVLPAADLPRADIAALAAGATAVEDAARIAADAAAERALLHLWNLAGETGGRLLVSGTGAPATWGIRLPDLASRLIAAPLAMLEPPCDRLLSALLAKLFADRQLAVAPGLVPYLTARMERSAAAAAALVARLDALALARGQAVTLRLAAEVLAEQSQDPLPQD
jgi:chromosomal replication initiation ATPase DnaA